MAEEAGRLFRSGRKTRGKAKARSVFRAPQGGKHMARRRLRQHVIARQCSHWRGNPDSFGRPKGRPCKSKPEFLRRGRRLGGPPILPLPQSLPFGKGGGAKRRRDRKTRETADPPPPLAETSKDRVARFPRVALPPFRKGAIINGRPGSSAPTEKPGISAKKQPAVWQAVFDMRLSYHSRFFSVSLEKTWATLPVKVKCT